MCIMHFVPQCFPVRVTSLDSHEPRSRLNKNRGRSQPSVILTWGRLETPNAICLTLPYLLDRALSFPKSVTLTSTTNLHRSLRLHFADEEIEIHRTFVTCPRSHNSEMTELAFFPDVTGYKH